jgi:Sensors of blue-light using FAD
MALQQLIYTSTPFGYDSNTLSSILIAARHFNKRDGITGALICRDDVFLQLLEGEPALVEALYGRIQRDSRHIDIATLVSVKVDARIFPEWDMLHDPARSWLWTPGEVSDGAVRHAGPAALLGVFTRVARETGEGA